MAKVRFTIAAAIALLSVPTVPLITSAAGIAQTPIEVAQASAQPPGATAPSGPAQKRTRVKARKHASVSAEVKAAQEALNKQGSKLTVDGKMGPKTHAAIRDFQKAKNLEITGRLDAATRKALGI